MNQATQQPQVPQFLEETPFVIDGHDYKITPLGALEGRRIWLRLLNRMAPAIKALGDHEKLNEGAFVAAIAAVLEGLDDDTTETLYAAFGRTCRVRQGNNWPLLEGVVFDLHFARRYVPMTQWLVKCVQINFAGFLGDGSLGKTLASLQAAVSARASQKDSTGSSGAS